jgi:hypothetical protein
LFKMIRDFVPARTSLASGIVIKQHLLERNKYPQPQIELENLDISGTLKPTWNNYEPGTVGNFEGQTGGVFDQFNLISNTSQSWYENITTPSGSVLMLHDSQDEFYNGEFSGSVILVTDGILNEAFSSENLEFEYKQVHYYGTSSNFSFASSSIENLIFENNFLNNVTSPQDGEILFYNEMVFVTIKIVNTFVTVWTGNWKTKYLKIAKTDCNGNNNAVALGQINKILIYIPSYNLYIPYNLTILNEQSNYYLYQSDTVQSYSPSLWPNQVFDYTVSASKGTTKNINAPSILNPFQNRINLWTSVTGNASHYGTPYFSSTLGYFTLENTPNTPLAFSSSITTSGSSTTNGSGTLSLRLYRNGNFSTLNQISGIILTTETTTTFTSSLVYPLQNDIYFLSLTRNVTGGSIPVLKSGSLLITQSRAVSASTCDPVILEPYITTPNFYNSDGNALLNNAFELRDSSYYMDVDYSSGLTEPVNFGQLISGSATRAKVQDSNYTSKRVTIPRYEGSKSTSQQLNKWTKGDIGTFGKLPTVESLKSYVAYGYMDGSWAPERMNASAFTIKYLIDQDGNISTPNISDISLSNTQQNFPSRDRFRYSSILGLSGTQGGTTNQFRNIIRGGYRIEPILYTQIGAQPGASWATGSDVISFTNIIPADQGTVTDVSGKYGLSTTLNYIGDSIVTFPSLITGTGLTNSPLSLGPIVASSSYEVPLEVIDEGINLSIGVKLLVNYNDPSPSTYNFDFLSVTIKRTTPLGNSSILFQKWIYSDYSQFNGISYPNALYTNTNYTIYVPALGEENLNPNDPVSPLSLPGQQQGFFTIPSSVLGVGDKITVEVFYPYSGPEILQIFSNSSFIIDQYPIALPSIDIPAPYTPNTLWGYPDPLNYPYIITSSDAGLCKAYGNPKIKQVNISGSGFNPTQLSFLLNVGDEFRFEGREDYTFEIKKIYAPQDEEDDYQIPRIFPTGSIEVHFSRDLPVSASVNSFNLDHFLIRRYVDDPSQIIFEGFRPTNGASPNSFILTPEYVIPKLNKNTDEFVKLLTEKGLIG